MKPRAPRKQINFDLKSSPELESAMAAFKPRFGNENDIRIVNAWGELKKILTYAIGDQDRYQQMQEITKNQKKRQEEIKQKERALLWMLGNRG